jgi:hypothetical protein
MTLRFYLYGTHSEGSETLPDKSFSFVVNDYRNLTAPSFLLWLYRDTQGKALLSKIQRTTRPATLGMRVDVYDARQIRIIPYALLESIFADSQKVVGLAMSGREQVDDVLLTREIVAVPDEKSEMVKNAIIKSNPTTIDESYFEPNARSGVTELDVEFKDAMHTAFGIFGISPPEMPPLSEQQILDFDIATLFADAIPIAISPDGRRCFEHSGRRLCLHKVDRTPFEHCLGVDLIYNYLEERRLVFIQYKCQRAKGKYYRSQDSSHDSEVQRMQAMPGLGECVNLTVKHIQEMRLCRCPVFIKLCRRDISQTHSIPVGVYFPLCVWKSLITQQPGISVGDEPHFNNPQFQDLVTSGLIGTTEDQAGAIQTHLDEVGVKDFWTWAVGHAVARTGDAGHRGFDLDCSFLQQKRFEHYRHSDFFHRQHFDSFWLPLLRRPPSHLTVVHSRTIENPERLRHIREGVRAMDAAGFGGLPNSKEVEIPYDLPPRWLEINPDIYTYLMDRRDDTCKGYINAMPMSATKFAQLKAGGCRDNSVGPADLLPFTHDENVRLYIMSIVTDPSLRRINAGLLHEGFEKLVNGLCDKLVYYAVEKNIRVTEIVAIAWTESGVRLCQLLGMVEVDKDEFGNPVYWVDLTSNRIPKHIFPGLARLLKVYSADQPQPTSVRGKGSRSR